jgi:hypothetical protein
MPVFGPGGEVVAAIELTVRNLGPDLRPAVAALSIATRSLSRETASDGSAARRPIDRDEPHQAAPPLAGADVLIADHWHCHFTYPQTGECASRRVRFLR